MLGSGVSYMLNIDEIYVCLNSVSSNQTRLTHFPSACTELYHCNYYLPNCGDGYDLGILWYVLYVVE